MEKDISVKEPTLDNEHFEHSLIATPQEIESGKLPPEEILSLPMFKVLFLCFLYTRLLESSLLTFEKEKQNECMQVYFLSL